MTRNSGSDYSANSLGLTAVAAIASSLANKVKLLDLSIIRSVVEVVMRPVEGGLTVKSNRYLNRKSWQERMRISQRCLQ